MIRRTPLLRRSSRRGKKTSKRRRSRLAMRREADRIFALAVKARDDWACRKCGSVVRLQAAHVISRRYHAVRWELDNCIALCAACHFGAHRDPLAFEAWVEERWPGRLAVLKERARAGVKWIDYEAILARLTGGPRYEV